jgi:hypothetical protein
MNKNYTEAGDTPGLVKTVTARIDFNHLGHSIAKDETFETDAETALELAHQRLIDPYRIVGGSFSLELMSDGYEKITSWDQSMGNLAAEPWFRVQFLVDIPGLLVKAGDKRRLRRSHALSFPYQYRSDISEYDQSNRTRSDNFQPALVIHELRPNRLPADVVAARMAAIAAAKAKEERGEWMRPVMATPMIPRS